MDQQRILLVDSSEEEISRLRAMLRTELTIDTARSRDQALRVFDKDLHQIVVADHLLADGTALELLQELRLLAPDLIFVLMTTEGGENLLREAFQAGAHDYLDKQLLERDPYFLQQVLDKAFEKLDFQILKHSLERELFNANQDLLLHNQNLLRNTDQLQLEKLKLEEKNRELEELTENLDNFLSICSHDLRSPISTVKSMSRFLLERARERLDNIEQDFLHRIIKNADYSLELIEKLLDSHELERGVRRHFEMLDVNAIINSVSHAFILQIRQMDLNFMCFNKVDDLELFGDRIKLTQLFNNLMVNAIRHTPQKGSISIEVEEERRGPTRHLVFSIFNTGSYIPPEYHERIFDKFEQVPGAPRSDGGRGLGLAICKGVCDLHGGSISVRSDQATGTTFIVSLPQYKDLEDLPGERPLSRPKVLLFGCDEALQKLFETLFGDAARVLAFNAVSKRFNQLLDHQVTHVVFDETVLSSTPSSAFRSLQSRGPSLQTLVVVHKYDESLLERYYRSINDVFSLPSDKAYMRWKLDYPLDHWLTEVADRSRVVLLVEADPERRQSFFDQLASDENLGVIPVANGYDALLAVRKIEVHLVIAARESTVMDGLELLTRLKLNYPELPVVLIGDRETPTEDLAARVLGAAAVFPSEVTLDTFGREVRQILGVAG
ncbi:MAG: hypothetical protein A2284_07480 [Deltaproteobacteria bacterium RIFOXYA12_FULL_61_11]|nr:MAG: hypothetical protein A2284_07480 [Deltaproteobacteria bacterium RIFOXYA12_FULL_61_11]